MFQLLSVLVGYSVITHAAVDISFEAGIPIIPNAQYGVFPTELNASNTTKVTLKRQAIVELLEQLEMPPILHSETREREEVKSEWRVVREAVPQCKVTRINRELGYRISVSDKEWLADQNWFCRMIRIFSDNWCTPDDLEELTGVGYVLATTDKTKTISEEIKPIEGSDCQSEVENSGEKIISFVKDRLRRSFVFQDFVDFFASLGETFENPVPIRDESHWFFRAYHSSSRVHREILSPLPEEKEYYEVRTPYKTKYVKQLVSIQIGKTLFLPDAKNPKIWRATFSPYSHVAYSGEIVRLEVNGLYSQSFGGQAHHKAILKNVPMKKHRFNNLVPSGSLDIQLADVTDVEVYRHKNSYAQRFVDGWRERVAEAKKNHERNNYGDFNCGDYFSHWGPWMCLNLDWVAGRTTYMEDQYVRLEFIDQDENKRFLTYRYQSRLERHCTGIKDDARCDTENVVVEKAHNPVDDLVEYLNDPAYGETTVLRFKIHSVLPKSAERFKPLSSPVQTQSNEFELVRQMIN